MKKDEPSKVYPLNMMYPKQVFPYGSELTVKNARQTRKHKDDYDYMMENRKLHKQLEEMQKENQFLKKQRHSSRRKSINGLSIHSETS